jgi:tetrahydromethanopterin S-methyltransferase subunit G
MQLKLKLDIDRIVVGEDDYEPMTSRITEIVMEETEAEIREHVRKELRRNVRLQGLIAQLQGVTLHIVLGAALKHLEEQDETSETSD